MTLRMTARRSWLVLGVATLLATPAIGQQDDDEAASTAQSCLDNRTIRRTTILSDRNILFVLRDGRTYNNSLPRQCPTMNRRSLITYPVDQNRLCAGSRIQVLWEINTGGQYSPAVMCELGLFVPISEDEAATLKERSDPRANRRESRRGTARGPVTATPVELPKPEATDPTPVPEPAQR